MMYPETSSDRQALNSNDLNTKQELWRKNVMAGFQIDHDPTFRVGSEEISQITHN